MNGTRSALSILSALPLACQASSACAVRVDAPAPGIEWKEGHLAAIREGRFKARMEQQ